MAFCMAVLGAAGGAPEVTFARQQPAGATLEVVAVGFDGRIRPGAWTPVWIEVTAGAADIDGMVAIEVPARFGQSVVTFGAPVRAAAGVRVRVFVPAIFFDARRPGTVHLESSGQRLASQPLPRAQVADEIVVVLSHEPLGVEAAATAFGRLAVVYVEPHLLPPRWQTYESVRLLVVRNLDERRLDDDQRIALQHWLWTGGRVLVMPAGDDVRHLRGPTLGPLGARGLGGRIGRGQVIEWKQDAADPQVRDDPGWVGRWRAVLSTPPHAPAPPLDAALPPARPVPIRTHIATAALVMLYVLTIRRLSRWLASLQPVRVVVMVAVTAVATIGAAGVAALVRREASGVVSVTTIEVLPGTGYGLLSMAGRTVSSHSGPFVIVAPRGLLMRPGATATVAMVVGEQSQLHGRGSGVQFSGSAVVPAEVSGTYLATGDRPVVRIVNKSKHLIQSPWIYRAGRVQRVTAVGESAEIALEESRWQAAERLPRTEEGHAMVVRTFSRLESDAILKTAPAWLVGWWRDPALALTWDGRAQAPLQLILVPLAVQR